jgi:hypothetical protein
MVHVRYRVGSSTLLALIALAALAASVAPRAAQTTAPTSDGHRIVAIGDVHGAHKELLGLLQRLRLVDASGQWSGGRATLVQTGDFTDRGADVRPVMDLLMRLEAQAGAAGGRALVLLGNHEVMNLFHILDDVSPAAYASFVDDRSDARRVEEFERYGALMRERRRVLGRDPPGAMDEAAWMRAYPPGKLEYLEAFGRTGTYGRWLRQRQAVIELDGTIFLHGGLNPDVAERSVEAINRRVRAEVERFDGAWTRLVERDVILASFGFTDGLTAAAADLQHWVTVAQTKPDELDPAFDRTEAERVLDLLQASKWSVLDPDGPLWFRGFATWTDAEGAPRVRELLERYQARRVVVGHTIPATHRILSRFDGRIFLIDTGMLSSVYTGGRPSALEIAGNQTTPVYMD